MFSLIKKIIFCFCILISAFGADDPSNFTNPEPRGLAQLLGYNAAIKAWLEKHEEGREFIKRYTFPATVDAYKKNKPLEEYRRFYEQRQARSSGASDQLGSTLRPLLQSSLGLADEHFAGPADQVMGHVASALGAQRQVADRVHDAQRRLVEEQVAAERARRDADLQQQQRARLEREAGVRQEEQTALETRHLMLQQRAHDAGIDVAAIGRDIEERLERMRERDAMGSALDALRFLTHYAQSQADIDGPLGQVVELNRKAKEFEQALKTRQVIEKDQLALLPFEQYSRIPFFDVTAYDRRFETLELQALLAWSVLQTSNKLTTADLTNIKQFAQLKQKDKPSEQEKKQIEDGSRDILALAARVEKDLLWQAFHSEQPLYYDEIFFWASLGKAHKFDTERLAKIKLASGVYFHFTTLAFLKASAEALNKNNLRLFAFQITAVQRELNPASTAAANFAFFDELNAASKKVVGDTESYKAAVRTGRFVNHARIAKLTKLQVGDAGALDIGNMHQLTRGALLEDLKKLEKLYFCLKESDADALSFMGLSKASGQLLNSSHSLVMQLVKYVTDYYDKVTGVLGSSVGAPLPAGVLGYERPKDVKINVVAPPALAKHLVSVLDVSDAEKEVKKLDGQIAKIRNDLAVKEKLRQSEVAFRTIAGILDQQKATITANFGAANPFMTLKKLSSNTSGVSAASIPETMFMFFQELATNTASLQAILGLEVVNLDSNYDNDLTLTGKDLVDCIADFAKPSRPPESREVRIRVKDDRPQAKNIHIVPFFYYLCNDLLKLLQAEMKKIGATDLQVLDTHLKGLVGELNALISATPKSKGDVRAALENNKFKDSVTASLKKVKFVDGTTIAITIKRATANMTPQELIGLLPDLMDAYTAPPSVASSGPAASAAASSRVGATTSLSAPPPPPPPPARVAAQRGAGSSSGATIPQPPSSSSSSAAAAAASTRTPPPPPPPPPPPSASRRVGSPTTKLVLGTDIVELDLITALSQLITNFGSMTVSPETEMRDLEAKKAASLAVINPDRKTYVDLSKGTQVSDGHFIALRDHTTAAILAFFKAINCRLYLNLKDLSDGFIVKFYNEFMKSIEFVLWNKIDAFGNQLTQEIRASKQAEVTVAKAEFVSTFGTKTLDGLVKQKLIKGDEADTVASTVLPVAVFKLRQPPYQQALDSIDIRTAPPFAPIITQYIANLQGSRASAVGISSSSSSSSAARRPATVSSADPFADAIRRLRKGQDDRLTRIKRRSDIELAGIAEHYRLLRDANDIYARIEGYVTASRDSVATVLPGLTAQLKLPLHGEDHSIAEIASIVSGYKNGSIVTNIIYDFFKLVVKELIESNAILNTSVDALDDAAARVAFNTDYVDGGKVEHFTVINVLLNDPRIVPACFRVVYENLATNRDNSHIVFAANVVRRFLDGFPAFLEEKVNAALDEDSSGTPVSDVSTPPPVLRGGGSSVASAAAASATSHSPETLLHAKLTETAAPFVEKYTALDAAAPEDINDQKMLLVIEFLENTGIVDARSLSDIKRSYETELKRIKGVQLQTIVGDLSGFQTRMADTFEKRLLTDLLKQKSTDPREVDLLTLYGENPRQKAISTLSDVHKGQNELVLTKRLERLSTDRTKTGWL